MKHLKIYEKKKKHIAIVGYPEGNMIFVNLNEFTELKKIFDISWVNELNYDEADYKGQWSYDYEEDNDAIEEWLENYRSIVKKIGTKRYKNTKKYNL